MSLGYWTDYMKIFIAHAQTIMYFKLYTMKISFYWTIQQDGVGLLHGLYENLHCACADNIMYFKALYNNVLSMPNNILHGQTSGTFIM